MTWKRVLRTLLTVLGVATLGLSLILGGVMLGVQACVPTIIRTLQGKGCPAVLLRAHRFALPRQGPLNTCGRKLWGPAALRGAHRAALCVHVRGMRAGSAHAATVPACLAVSSDLQPCTGQQAGPQAGHALTSLHSAVPAARAATVSAPPPGNSLGLMLTSKEYQAVRSAALQL